MRIGSCFVSPNQRHYSIGWQRGVKPPEGFDHPTVGKDLPRIEGQFGRTDHNVKRFVGGKSGVLLLFPNHTKKTPLKRLPRITGKYGPGWPNSRVTSLCGASFTRRPGIR
jgi:hypothetical protein